MKKAGFIVLGKSKRKEKFLAEVKQEFSSEFDLDIRITTAKINAIDHTRRMINEGVKIIILAGGDGTLNEGINGYFQAEENHRIGCVFGFMPIGSGNDFVKSLPFKPGLKQLLHSIQNNNVENIDCGRISMMSETLEEYERYFLNISDIGLGGHAARLIRGKKRRFSPFLTYMIAAIKSFIQYKKKVVKIQSKEQSWRGKMMMVCMANGKFFADGLCIAPHSELQNGKMEIVVMGNVTLVDYFQYLPSLKRKKPLIHPEINYFFTEQCKIEGVEEQCPVDMDGEFVGFTPLTMTCVPSSLPVYWG